MEIPIFGFRFSVSGFRFSVSGFRFQVSGFPRSLESRFTVRLDIFVVLEVESRLVRWKLTVDSPRAILAAGFANNVFSHLKYTYNRIHDLARSPRNQDFLKATV